MNREVRIATRKSPLALWQAEHVAERLRTAHPGLTVNLLPMVTEGDRIQGSLTNVGGKGLFTKELESAILDGRADIAVHSMKDMPADLPAGLVIGAALERADPRDALVSVSHASLAALPRGARVGTSSLRRQSQLRHARPDLEILSLRGNVETRLHKLDAGDFDATVLAAAGLERLGLGARIREKLGADQMLPAVGQGVIGVECRDDPEMRKLLRPLEHAPTRTCLDAERAYSARLGGGCQSPIAAYAHLECSRLKLRGLVGSPDGAQVFADAIEGAATEGTILGTALAERMLAAGAEDLLQALAAGGGH
jgi:hydroxymethylbilane synthase